MMHIDLPYGHISLVASGSSHEPIWRFSCLVSVSFFLQSAFRAKALEYHPDQNQDNKGDKSLYSVDYYYLIFSCAYLHITLDATDAAEAKFKEVLTSYEAIKSERKNSK